MLAYSTEHEVCVCFLGGDKNIISSMSEGYRLVAVNSIHFVEVIFIPQIVGNVLNYGAPVYTVSSNLLNARKARTQLTLIGSGNPFHSIVNYVFRRKGVKRNGSMLVEVCAENLGQGRGAVAAGGL